MTMLKHEFEPARARRALDMLLIDRNNEFKALAESIFQGVPESKRPAGGWEEFILGFCLDVSGAFSTWNGSEPLEANSDLKALTFLRQLARGKKTMTELCHLLNLSYTLAEEFRVVYRRIG